MILRVQHHSFLPLWKRGARHEVPSGRPWMAAPGFQTKQDCEVRKQGDFEKILPLAGCAFLLHSRVQGCRPWQPAHRKTASPPFPKEGMRHISHVRGVGQYFPPLEKGGEARSAERAAMDGCPGLSSEAGLRSAKEGDFSDRKSSPTLLFQRRECIGLWTH